MSGRYVTCGLSSLNKKLLSAGARFGLRSDNITSFHFDCLAVFALSSSDLLSVSSCECGDCLAVSFYQCPHVNVEAHQFVGQKCSSGVVLCSNCVVVLHAVVTYYLCVAS